MMGLPDLRPIHDIYVDRLRDMVAEGVTPETVDRMVRAWAPVGEAGMAAWRQMMDRMVGGAAG